MPRRNLYLLTTLVLVSLACFFRTDRCWQIVAFAMNQIDHRALEKTDRHKLVEGALGGMMKQLEDEHSVYISPRMLADVKRTLDGQFEGIGIEVAMDTESQQLVVVSPLYGSPAELAGLRPRDRILRIDGKSTKGMSLQDASDLMRGQEGSAVLLSILHAGQELPAEIKIVRAAVHVDTVIGLTRSPKGAWDYSVEGHPGIGYVRITRFGEGTAEELGHVLERLEAGGMQGLVVDLRDNRGGLLRSAVEICNAFIESGVIVTTRRRDGSVKDEYKADGQARFAGQPIAVLVNAESASASEIVAACLQDHGRAKIIGQRTFGKGTVQEVIDLQPDRGPAALSSPGNWGALKLTTASYWRPSGRNIHRHKGAAATDAWGVMPDEGFDVAGEADQLAQAVKYVAAAIKP
jgi:carboxyl-terminal processing protease